MSRKRQLYRLRARVYCEAVTWLEATIACPVFSGLVTYYVEGDAAQRGHMMEQPLARAKRAWAVRGNIFFLPVTMGAGYGATF